MTTLTNLDTKQTVTVPEDVADIHLAGWVIPGSPAPAEPGLDSLTIPTRRDFAEEDGVDLTGVKRKPEIIAAIEKLVGPPA